MPEQRPIPGYPGYFADELAQIWDTRHNYKDRAPRLLKQSIVNPNKNNCLYLAVHLRVGTKYRTRLVHRLVTLAFHGLPPFPGAQALHKDDHKTNNVPANLAWGTGQQNRADAVRNGCYPTGPGSRAYWGRLQPSDIPAIRAAIAEGKRTLTAIGEEYGTSRRNISRIKHKHIWRNIE